MFREYGNPCEKFCPAAVTKEFHEKSNRPELKVNFSNACTVRHVICRSVPDHQLVTPEGGAARITKVCNCNTTTNERYVFNRYTRRTIREENMSLINNDEVEGKGEGKGLRKVKPEN